MDNVPIPQETKTVYLGIDRNLKAAGNVEKKAQLGRRMMYQLMDVRAYGNSGLNPIVSPKNVENICPPLNAVRV